MKLTMLSLASTAKIVCAFVLMGLMQVPTPALAKVDVVIHTGESMKEHTSDEPRRFMHDVLLDEFKKGNTFNIINEENSPQPTKHHVVPYHVGANLIAFHPHEKMPVRVSISMQLVKYESGKVIMSSDESLDVAPSVIVSALKLHNRDFDNSEYGRNLTYLFRVASRKFEERVKELKLN